VGLGDWIMATAQVKRLNERTGHPVMVVGRHNQPVWSEVFENNPRLVKQPARKPFEFLLNASGIRPYIASKTAARWTWREWDIAPGELYLTDAERAAAAPYAGLIMVEPNVKANGHTNKAWPWDRWQALVDLDIAPLVQCGAPGTRWLEGVERVETPTFRAAAAVLAASRAFVGTEGALHHAAAAFGVPSVVLWSEFIEPRFTGYATQKNLRHAGKSCGSRLPCQSCAASMQAIAVGEVAANLVETLH
jgi:ADP-heptose:LPS heptosyltransferase